MSRFLSSKYEDLEPYTPGEQPKNMKKLIKLNTNENPSPPSPRVLEAIRRDAAEKAGKQKAEPGRVLVRYFHTEMREQLILCTDQSGRRTAWLSLLIPPLPALECNMIEYRDAEDCVDYYEAVKRRSEPCPVAVPGRMHGKD